MGEGMEINISKDDYEEILNYCVDHVPPTFFQGVDIDGEDREPLFARRKKHPNYVLYCYMNHLKYKQGIDSLTISQLKSALKEHRLAKTDMSSDLTIYRTRIKEWNNLPLWKKILKVIKGDSI